MDENTLNMLERLASLKENGTITEQEFNEQKQKILKTKKEEEEIEPTAPASKTTNKTGGFFKRIGAYIVVIFLGVPMCIAIISPSTHNTPTKSQRRPIKQINGTYIAKQGIYIQWKQIQQQQNRIKITL